MRLTIAQRQYLAFLALTMLVLLVTLGLANWNFESGFLAFIEAQEQQRLSNLGDDLLEEYERAGENWALADGSLLNRLLSPRRVVRVDRDPVRDPGFRPDSGPGFEPGPRPGSGRGPGPGRSGERGPGADRGPGAGPGPRFDGTPPPVRPPRLDEPPKSLRAGRGKNKRGRRSPYNAPTALYDLQDRYVAGAPGLDGPERVVIPLVFDGQPVGELRSLPRQKFRSAEENQFVERQRNTKWVIGFASLLVAAIIAYLLSASIQRPIRRMTNGIKELSNGNYAPGLKTSRTDELGGLMNDLHRLSTTLDEGQSARRRWLADISHELRTPLAALTAEIEALKDGVRTFGPERLLSLDAQTTRLRLLVEDLYELSLSDVGGMRYSYEAVELKVELARLIEQAKDRAGGLELTLSVAEPLYINADPHRIDQLINNLLTNAVAYTDVPGSIAVSLKRQDGRAVIEVMDTPPGVTIQECERLFEPLYRRESARDRNRGGAGLGLAICKNIADAHQANIRAYPATSGGLCVRVDFPILRV